MSEIPDSFKKALRSTMGIKESELPLDGGDEKYSGYFIVLGAIRAALEESGCEMFDKEWLGFLSGLE